MHVQQNIKHRSTVGHGRLNKLFICVTNLLAHQVLDSVSFFLNQMFCFTVLGIYFLLVVYSLYREMKGTAPSNNA
jgi:hypothetical protein